VKLGGVDIFTELTDELGISTRALGIDLPAGTVIKQWGAFPEKIRGINVCVLGSFDQLLKQWPTDGLRNLTHRRGCVFQPAIGTAILT